MTQQFTDEDFKALSAHAAKLAQEQQQQPMVQAPPVPMPAPAPVPAPQLSNRTLIVGAVGGGVILLMALGAIAGLMQRPSQPQATATPSPSPTPVVVASPSPTPSPSPSPSPVMAAPTHVVWGNPGDVLNIRSAPDGDVIGGIPAGSQIVVTGYEGRWAITSWDGVTGYVSQKFLIPIGQDRGGR